MNSNIKFIDHRNDIIKFFNIQVAPQADSNPLKKQKGGFGTGKAATMCAKGAILGINTPKRDDEHLHLFHMGVHPHPPGEAISEIGRFSAKMGGLESLKFFLYFMVSLFCVA